LAHFAFCKKGDYGQIMVTNTSLPNRPDPVVLKDAWTRTD